MDSNELQQRTKAFALRVIKLCSSLPRDDVANVLKRQLLRAGTSVGANYRAACRSRSRAEFVSKMAIVEEEADECVYWLELLMESKQVAEERVSALHAEANELTAIAVASRKTAKYGANRQSSIADRQ